MRVVYIIFSVAGWAWLALVLAALAWRLRKDAKGELPEPHAQQS